MITTKPTLTDVQHYLNSLPFLSELPEEEVRFVYKHIEFVAFKDRTPIVKKGEKGDACYFVYDGEVEVVGRDLIGLDTVLATLGIGRIFGEVTLYRENVRKTSVRAKSDVFLLKMSHQSLEQIGYGAPNFFKQLENFSLQRQKTTFMRLASIFARLPEAIIDRLGQQSSYRQVTTGQVVVREGEFGHQFYMVISGELDVKAGTAVMETLRTGDFFGEYGLIRNQSEPFSVVSRGDCELLILPRDSFQHVLEDHESLRTQFEEVIRIRNKEAFIESFNQAAVHAPLIESGKKREHWTIMGAGLFCFIVLSISCIRLENDWLLILAIAIGSFIGPLAFVNYLHTRSILGNQPYLLVLLFFLTALIGIPLAYKLEGLDLFANANPYLISMSTACIEETSKILLVIILIRRKRSRFLMDSVVYGAAAGMGFAAIESIIYGLNTLHNPQQALTVILYRALLSPFGHGTWTAIAATGIWYLLLHQKWLRFGLLIAVTLGMHVLWNLQISSNEVHLLQMLTVGSLGLLLLRMFVRRGISDERRSIISLNPELLAMEGNLKYMKCGNCLSELPYGAHYCPRCAQAMRAAEE
ncbi:cyclic nucleotide-binding domain-containing protein [Paenibacillus sp. R14(2021)]|uniref:cyclic nucleotide-binding domain-containing protein n=1 Tax=Paenibacillus sp. R14(2021) TaxID=2859228 RepID=UPI001C612ED7|nr:cyclic nucleotide-binding domain-containing protein [Paenibacillus sp. R14(2021)]